MRNHLILLKRGKPINLFRRSNNSVVQSKSSVDNEIGEFQVSGGSLYQTRRTQMLRASSTDVTAPNRIINQQLNRRPLKLML